MCMVVLVVWCWLIIGCRVSVDGVFFFSFSLVCSVLICLVGSLIDWLCSSLCGRLILLYWVCLRWLIW